MVGRVSELLKRFDGAACCLLLGFLIGIAMVVSNQLRIGVVIIGLATLGVIGRLVARGHENDARRQQLEFLIAPTLFVALGLGFCTIGALVLLGRFAASPGRAGGLILGGVGAIACGIYLFRLISAWNRPRPDQEPDSRT